jgi:hypothetical protein
MTSRRPGRPHMAADGDAGQQPRPIRPHNDQSAAPRPPSSGWTTAYRTADIARCPAADLSPSVTKGQHAGQANQAPGEPIPADQSRHVEPHRVNIAQGFRLWPSDCSVFVWSDVRCSQRMTRQTGRRPTASGSSAPITPTPSPHEPTWQRRGRTATSDHQR